MNILYGHQARGSFLGTFKSRTVGRSPTAKNGTHCLRTTKHPEIRKQLLSSGCVVISHISWPNSIFWHTPTHLTNCLPYESSLPQDRSQEFVYPAYLAPKVQACDLGSTNQQHPCKNSFQKSGAKERGSVWNSLWWELVEYGRETPSLKR